MKERRIDNSDPVKSDYMDLNGNKTHLEHSDVVALHKRNRDTGVNQYFIKYDMTRGCWAKKENYDKINSKWMSVTEYQYENYLNYIKTIPGADGKYYRAASTPDNTPTSMPVKKGKLSQAEKEIIKAYDTSKNGAVQELAKILQRTESIIIKFLEETPKAETEHTTNAMPKMDNYLEPVKANDGRVVGRVMTDNGSSLVDRLPSNHNTPKSSEHIFIPFK